MKNITINKKAKVTADAEFQEKGVVAFQVVEFVFKYFGVDVVREHNTRIMQDGRQFVIDGDGFIKAGFEVFND